MARPGIEIPTFLGRKEGFSVKLKKTDGPGVVLQNCVFNNFTFLGLPEFYNQHQSSFSAYQKLGVKKKVDSFPMNELIVSCTKTIVI